MKEVRTYRYQTRLILIITALICGTAVLLLLIVLPLFRKVVATQSGIAENQAKLRQIATEIQNYKTLSNDLLKVATEQKYLEQMFPVRENMVSLVEGLERAVSDANLNSKLTIVDNKEKQEQNPNSREKPAPPIIPSLSRLEEIPYILQITGNYRGMIDFFHYLEHLPFITITDKLSVTADKAQSSETGILRNAGTATAKLEGVLYILNP